MNWLFSYPGSGSNYIRYCIEFLSKEPTQGPVRLIPHNRDYILMRSHYAVELPTDEKIGILIRNPFELIFRDNLFNNSDVELEHNMHKICGRYQSFLECFPKSKIFYYEEIINDVKNLRNLIEYFEIPTKEDFKTFELDIQHHKNISYDLGNEFYSDKSELFYSKNLSSYKYNILHDIILSYPKNLINLLQIYFR